MPYSLTKRRLTITYTMALIVMTFMVIVTAAAQYVLVKDYQSVAALQDDAESVLSSIQELALILNEALTNQLDASEFSALLRVARVDQDALQKSVPELVRGAKQQSVTGSWLFAHQRDIYAIHASIIDERLHAFLQEVQGIAAGDLPPFYAHVPRESRALAQDRLNYLIHSAQLELDAFIALASSDAESRLSYLTNTLVMFVVGFILAAICLGVLVFRPLIDDVMSSHRSQQSANAELQRHAQELSDSREGSRQQTRILKSVLDALADAVIVVNERGKIILQNPAADSLFGIDSQSLDAATWHAALQVRGMNGSDISLQDSPLSLALTGRRINDRLVQIAAGHQHQGTQVTLSANGRPIVDEDSVIRGAVVSFRDVSSHIANEQDLIKAKSNAEAASRAKNEFIANVSHEIRTPMSTILGYADRLTISDLEPQERRRAIDVIRSSGRILVRLIDDLLDISRMEAGQTDVETSVVPLGELLGEVRGLLEGRASQQGLTFEFVASGPVPIEIHTDPIRVRQVLINLLGNALKFTEMGGITCRVFWDDRRRFGNAPKLAFEISDTGSGIHSESVPKLFQPFMQGDTSMTRRFGGTGLGLALSRRLARALGGELKLEWTEVGKGSCFLFHIDIGPAEKLTFTDSLQIPKSTALIGEEELFPATGLQGTRILVVEDGPENRELFTSFLQHAGAEVVSAVDGQEALDIVEDQSFDLIIMDIQMPRLDGIKAAEILRARGVDTPMIALTAHAMIEHRERSLEAGFDHHLAKPVDAKALIGAAINYARVHARAHGAIRSSARSGARGHSNEVSEIIARFSTSIPERVNEMLVAFDHKDWDRLEKLAHRLKGTAGACGFLDLMEAVAHIEDCLRAGHSSGLRRDCIENLRPIAGKENKDKGHSGIHLV